MYFKNKEDGILYFQKLGYKIKEGPNWFLIIPKKEYLLKAKNDSKKKMLARYCNLCNSKFEFGSARQNNCLHCILYVKCTNCNIYFESNNNTKYVIEQVSNGNLIESFCSKDCSNKFNIIKAHNTLNENPEIRINVGKKNIKIANKYWETHKEERLENLQKANKYWDQHPNEAKKQRETARNKAHQKLKNLWCDEVWSKRQKEISSRNILIANKLKIEEMKQKVSNLNINIFESYIDISNILELKNNDICGTYLIKAKFKNDIQTNKEKNIYKLLVCKSKRIYNEIYWILRVLSQPEKQDKNAEWTIAKWWYIANLYYDFEFILLTDPNGISEEDALLYEAKYAIDNDLFVEFKSLKNPKIDKHAYFSL